MRTWFFVFGLGVGIVSTVVTACLLQLSDERKRRGWPRIRHPLEIARALDIVKLGANVTSPQFQLRSWHVEQTLLWVMGKPSKLEAVLKNNAPILATKDTPLRPDQ